MNRARVATANCRNSGVCFVGAGLTAIALSALHAPACAQSADWPTYGGAPGGGQYSPLNQINRDNVGKLEVAWTYCTGDLPDDDAGDHPTTFEANPILADGRLYFCTPFNRVIALDAETGRELWSHDPGIDRARSHLGAHVCRGVSHWADATTTAVHCSRRIFTATGAGELIALDAENGRRCPDFGRGGRIDLNDYGYRGSTRVGVTSPPAIVGNVVIVGHATPSYGASDTADGIVRAFDAVSGAPRWEWEPIPEPLRDRTGGVNVWAPMAVDVERGRVLLATTSPTPDPYGGDRLDPLPYANAVVALDAETGQPVWHFQTVRHDLFDYDLPAQPALVPLKTQDSERQVVVQITKMGYTFVLERDSGRPVFPVREQPAPVSAVPGERTAPTQPAPVLPEPFTRQSLRADEAWGLTPWDRGRCRDDIAALRNDGLYTPPSFEGSVMIPNTSGGGNWGGLAFDPESATMIVNASQIAFWSRIVRRDDYERGAPPALGKFGHTALMTGTPYVWLSAPILSPLGIPCTPPPWGTVTAINLKTGETLWEHPLGQVPLAGPLKTPRAWGSPNMGGPIVTAGDVVFIGATLDSGFRALDLKTGAELWRADLAAPGMATPMTYAIKNRQFVVIAAGGHAALDTKLSDTIVAFSLPASVSAGGATR